MNTYCINLDGRPDRWMQTKIESDKLWAEAIRFKAIKHERGHTGCKQSHLALLRQVKDDGEFIMMVLVMLKVYEDSSIGAWFFSKWWPFPSFIIVIFGLFIVIGYLDRRYIRPKEMGEINKVNPELMEMHKKIMKL